MTEKAFFGRFPWLLGGLLALFLALGLGIRLYDLTDPPFDFHATRQWRSALIARGMYYQGREDIPEWQRRTAVNQWQRENVIEPPVMEFLVSLGYRLAGQEQLWIARLFASSIWVIGGLAIFLLGRQLGSVDGGLLAAAYYLFLPYGMIASRAFQPDPLMVALMAGTFWAALRWQRRRTLGAAVLAGVLAGFTIFVKSSAVFIIAGALAGLILGDAFSGRGASAVQAAGGGDGHQAAQQPESGDPGSPQWRLPALLSDRQVQVLFALTVLPTAIYYFYGLFIDGFLRQQLKFRFFPEMWRDPAFYIRWVEFSSDIVGYGALLAALVGIFLLRRRAQRWMLLGMWAGYLAYSMTFPFHTITHDYYTLPLIPVVAVSLVPLAAIVLGGLARLEARLWLRLAVAGVIGFGILFKVWDTRVILARQDFRPLAAEWTAYQEIIPPGAQVVAITRAYGYPLAYYGWVNAALWLSNSDAALRELAGQSEVDIENKRIESLEDKDLFLITNFNEFEEQPGLKKLLEEGYAVFAEGSGYLIYDLNAPR